MAVYGKSCTYITEGGGGVSGQIFFLISKGICIAKVVDP